ncbi:hypothetical protein WICPIJ_001028 [Wickerhamomyces pijperi]|uniref:Uncharacterized protein n=1 Tax=Wickerhamomyces pijperi TaxID=599730 RepID=A0A9P8QEJ9_WICPI|nr:hypothetical protein WICPIJ_001028 [Wickerhamomyces pijperi]
MPSTNAINPSTSDLKLFLGLLPNELINEVLEHLQKGLNHRQVTELIPYDMFQNLIPCYLPLSNVPLKDIKCFQPFPHQLRHAYHFLNYNQFLGKVRLHYTSCNIKEESLTLFVELKEYVPFFDAKAPVLAVVRGANNNYKEDLAPTTLANNSLDFINILQFIKERRGHTCLFLSSPVSNIDIEQFNADNITLVLDAGVAKSLTYTGIRKFNKETFLDLERRHQRVLFTADYLDEMVPYAKLVEVEHIANSMQLCCLNSEEMDTHEVLTLGYKDDYMTKMIRQLPAVKYRQLLEFTQERFGYHGIFSDHILGSVSFDHLTIFTIYNMGIKEITQCHFRSLQTLEITEAFPHSKFSISKNQFPELRNIVLNVGALDRIESNTYGPAKLEFFVLNTYHPHKERYSKGSVSDIPMLLQRCTRFYMNNSVKISHALDYTISESSERFSGLKVLALSNMSIGLLNKVLKSSLLGNIEELCLSLISLRDYSTLDANYMFGPRPGHSFVHSDTVLNLRNPNLRIKTLRIENSCVDVVIRSLGMNTIYYTQPLKDHKEFFDMKQQGYFRMRYGAEWPYGKSNKKPPKFYIVDCSRVQKDKVELTIDGQAEADSSKQVAMCVSGILDQSGLKRFSVQFDRCMKLIGSQTGDDIHNERIKDPESDFSTSE